VGILSRAGDLAYTLRFLRLLTTKFEDTTAFKLGLIDEKGKKLKKAQTSEEKAAYNTFHRLVFNLKKLLAKVPGGSSTFASYASALFLLKEKEGLDDDTIEKLCVELGIDPLDLIAEESTWCITKDGMLSPGIYSLLEEKLVSSTCEPLCKEGDKVVVEMDCYPVGNLLGHEIYEVTHKSTRQKLYVSPREMLKVREMAAMTTGQAGIPQDTSNMMPKKKRKSNILTRNYIEIMGKRKKLVK
jgi:hypothetical protein